MGMMNGEVAEWPCSKEVMFCHYWHASFGANMSCYDSTVLSLMLNLLPVSDVCIVAGQAHELARQVRTCKEMMWSSPSRASGSHPLGLSVWARRRAGWWGVAYAHGEVKPLVAWAIVLCVGIL